MALAEALVLPPDVEIVSVVRLSGDLRSRLACADDEFLVTRPLGRGGSHVVDEPTAALLALFRSPTRVVDAVLAYARVQACDPDETLDSVYPVLFRLWQERLLVSPDGPDAEPIAESLRPGDAMGSCTVVRCIQAFEDTEVHLARAADGRFVALKVARDSGGSAGARLAHEAAILRRLDGGPIAPLVELTAHDGRTALVTEWVNGADAGSHARGMRRPGEQRDDVALLGLCRAVARAVARIHAAGVVHGDITPHNLLIDRARRVRLIDFGLARDLRDLAAAVPRGGVPFYFEPEYATALLDGGEVPATPLGEQYAVAALIYHLWTGVHHLDWRLERTEMLRQIADDPPVPFAGHRAPAWPEFEAVLARSLHKDPAARYRSVASLAAALDDLTPRTVGPTPGPARDIVGGFLARCQDTTPGPPDAAPVASLTYGAAGIAYALYRIAMLRGNTQLIALADRWVHHADALAGEPDAFYSDELGVEHAIAGDVSVFHTVLGLSFVRVLVSAAIGDADAMQRGVARLVDRSRLPCDNPDLTVGQASPLLALAEIVEALPPADGVGRALALARGGELARELADVLRRGSALHHLGVAHGDAGVAHALLRWSAATGTDPDPVVAECLDELLEIAEPHAGGLRWPVEPASGPAHYVDGWCNGAAGHAMVFGLAHERLGRNDYAEAALSAALSAAATETELGTLCCGLGGVAYALLCAHRISGDPCWRALAERTARRAARCHGPTFHRDALYKGEVGVAVLLEDLRSAERPGMPVFESAG
jgi:serine/threonine-protein kinase